MKFQNIIVAMFGAFGATASAEMTKSICMSNGYQYGIAPKSLDGITSGEMICSYEGGHLASFSNNAEFSVLRALALETDYDFVYLGLVDHDGDNKDYVWLDGTNNDFVVTEKSHPWGSTEPNGNGEFCTVMFKSTNYLIGDHFCNRQDFAVACKFECV